MTAYDAENHLIGAGWNNGAPAVDYAYDAQGKRYFMWTAGTLDPWGGNDTNYSVVMYSPSGQKLGTYLISVCNQGANNTTSLTICSALSTSDRYFGGRRLAVMDQLGSAGTYYPWGEAKGSTNPQDAWSYATYWRDSVSGLDYANQRYYSNTYGRFMTRTRIAEQRWPGDSPILKAGTVRLTSGDPINSLDRGGLCQTATYYQNGQYIGTDTDLSDCDTSVGATGVITGLASGSGVHGINIPAVAIAQYQAALGMSVARAGLAAFASMVFSPECKNFIDNALGAGALEVAQLDAAQTGVVPAVIMNSPAGATLFPTDPADAASTQDRANNATGIAGATLAQWAAVSGNTYAWGQWAGKAVYINNPINWSGFGAGLPCLQCSMRYSTWQR